MLSHSGLIIPGPCTGQLEIAHLPQRLLKLSKLPKSQTCSPCLLCSFPWKPQKSFFPSFLLSLCLHTNPSATPCGPLWYGMSLLLGICEYDNLLNSNNLLTLPYLNNNKTDIKTNAQATSSRKPLLIVLVSITYLFFSVP